MAWFDEHPDTDVTDLFTLLNEIIDTAEGVDAAHFTSSGGLNGDKPKGTSGMPSLKMSQSAPQLPPGSSGTAVPSMSIKPKLGALSLEKATSNKELELASKDSPAHSRRDDLAHVEDVLGKMVDDYSARDGYSAGEIEKMVTRPLFFPKSRRSHLRVLTPRSKASVCWRTKTVVLPRTHLVLLSLSSTRKRDTSPFLPWRSLGIFLITFLMCLTRMATARST
jgi:hypothetical protein